MRLLGSNKPTVSSTGFRDIRINIWGEKYGPRPRPVGLILLLILVVIALGGLYPAYQWEADAADETAGLQEELESIEQQNEALKRPPEEELEIAKIEDEIDTLRTARETVEAGYGNLAATVDLILATIPQASCLDSINLGSDKISLKGEADTPSSLFALADALKEQNDFDEAYIKNIGKINDSGRVLAMTDISTGTVDVTELLTVTETTGKSTATPGEIMSDIIRDPTEAETGHESTPESAESVSIASELFWGLKNLFTNKIVNRTVVSGNLAEPPVTCKFEAVIKSYYPMASYTWDFGDGTIREVNLKQPGPENEWVPMSALHTYTEEGAFTAKLSVSDDQGHNVSATRAGIFATADTDFIAEVSYCNDPLTIEFIPQIVSAEKIVSYKWDFGEDEEGAGGLEEGENEEPDSIEKEPIHTFEEAGEYTVTLTVEGQQRKPISITHKVVASEAPIADFYPERIGDSGEFTVRFADASVPDGYNDSKGDPHEMAFWEWNFGDGTTASGSPNPVHTYAGEGPYTVTLKAVESDANCDTITKIVQACEMEHDKFIVNSGAGDLQINFAAPVASTDTVEFLWDFGVFDDEGEAITSSQANPSYTYDYSGTYHVTLRIIEEGESTKSEVESRVTFISADIEVISSTSTPFQIEVIR